MLNKFLLISLGGSGEKLARYLNQDLEQRLRASGWKRGVPRALRALCVDVAHANDDILARDVPTDLGRHGSRVGLAASDLRYDHYRDQLTRREEALQGLLGALPNDEVELPPPFKGAGQRPQVGNVVGLVRLGKLRAEIERQMVALGADGVGDELRELAAHLDPDHEPAAPGTLVLIASSLGGGSGAGLLQLTTEVVLNTIANDAEIEVATALFTPEIFRDLTELERQGVQANSLYTLATMLNGYHGKGEPPESLADLLNVGGIALNERRRSAATNFFLGGGNDEIEFLDQNTAIKAAAAALGRMLLDEEVSSSLSSHLKTNGEGAALTADYRIAPRKDLTRPASSLGYACVSLGSAQLAEYSSERLAKLQLETLLRGHRRRRAPKETDDETVERIAGEELPRFLERTRLREEDVLDGLFDRDELRAEVQARVQQVEGTIRDGRTHDAPKNWLNHIERSFDAYQREFEKSRRASEAEKPGIWCEAAQLAVLEATVDLIGRRGLPVAIAVLDAAARRISEVVAELRIQREEEVQPKVVGLRDQARQLLGSAKGRVLPNTDESLAKAASARGKAVFLAEDVAYRKLAAELLAGLPAGLLEPLRTCLAESREALASTEQEGFAELVASWSSGPVPPRMEPAPNHVCLQPVDRFPEEFEELLEETIGMPIVDAEEAAAAELIAGGWLSGEGGTELIGARRGWRHDSGTPSQFSLSLEIPGLKARADRWIRERPGAMADRLALSIAEWIAAEPGRAAAFAEGFERAQRRSAPLARINAAVHQRVHGRVPEGAKLHVSTVPVEPGSAVHDRLEKSLRGSVADGELRALFDPTSGASRIEFSSFFAQPVEPVVVEGLMRPIAKDWMGRTDAWARSRFSDFRRTRPLPLFVPLAPADQRRFVRGWIAAELLGYLSPLRGSWDREPLRVWSPTGWLGLPDHLLGDGDVSDDSELLGRVMESLPLALVSYACEDYEALDAYMRILDLGDLRALVEWVRTGVGEARAETGRERPGDGRCPADRSRSMLAAVEEMRAADEAHRDETEPSRDNVTEIGPRLEVIPLRLEALDEIERALMAPPPPPVAADGPGDGPVPDPAPLTT